VSTFLESIAVVELNSPAFLALVALYTVITFWLAVASRISLSDTASKSKLGLQVVWKK
jgi:hypothetical protein